MRKISLMIAAVLSFGLVATATDFSNSELFLGYNLTRFHPNSGYIPDFNANGGNAAFTYNFSKWFAGTVDIGSVTQSTFNHANWDTTATSFTIGPRFTYHNHSHFTPYFEVLFGAAESSVSTDVGTYATTLPTTLPSSVVVLPPGNVFTTHIEASKTGFAMLVGGGLDIKIFKHMSFRPIGLDYYLMRMPSALTGNDTNLNNLRYSAGINFLFGAK